ncbi:hypothetical protein EJ04DRAFT_523901 [Polyplosphaeria fusca]|uniref:Uncharacterized protein n=1 Tax=Polyplosphaeria fusca TaxID=682080 RepID=A0A9P4V157_9PLEO|nr:hypothetical protein EJ04DRAFT_523901 [Polyplosphaeria fusca]
MSAWTDFKRSLATLFNPPPPPPPLAYSPSSTPIPSPPPPPTRPPRPRTSTRPHPSPPTPTLISPPPPPPPHLSNLYISRTPEPTLRDFTSTHFIILPRTQLLARGTSGLESLSKQARWGPAFAGIQHLLDVMLREDVLAQLQVMWEEEQGVKEGEGARRDSVDEFLSGVGSCESRLEPLFEVERDVEILISRMGGGVFVRRGDRRVFRVRWGKRQRSRERRSDGGRKRGGGRTDVAEELLGDESDWEVLGWEEDED